MVCCAPSNLDCKTALSTSSFLVVSLRSLISASFFAISASFKARILADLSASALIFSLRGL